MGLTSSRPWAKDVSAHSIFERRREHRERHGKEQREGRATSKGHLIQPASTGGIFSLLPTEPGWSSPGEMETVPHPHSSAEVLSKDVCNQLMRRKSSTDMLNVEKKVSRCVSEDKFPRNLQRQLQRREI